MLFNSVSFLFVFLPLTLFLFFFLGRWGGRYARIALALLSFAFYAYWDVRYLPLLVGSIAVNYLVGRGISHFRSAGKSTLARSTCAFGIVLNLSFLAVFKYANLFLGSLQPLFQLPFEVPHIVLPIGISFFTFTQIAFLVDTHAGKAEEHNAWDYALFVSYFPHQIAGPILHHREMMSQFNAMQKPRWSLGQFQVGLAVLGIGLVKKILCADPLSSFADPIFSAAEHGAPIQFFEAWAGTLAYTLQLYFDFSAYSDMAIGISFMFGIKLPINFNSPYKSTSIIEFWQRWHITLSRFLREYLYIPLGGNRKGNLRRYLNLFITMALGGLWHGASWTFLAWGALHGVYLAINHAWRTFRSSPEGTPVKASAFARTSSWALTFLAVVVAWVFFRATTFDAAIRLLRAMFGGEGIAVPPGWAQYVADSCCMTAQAGWLGSFSLARGGSLILGLMLICLVMPNVQQMFALDQPALIHGAQDKPPTHLLWRANVGWALLIGLGAGIALSRLGNDSQFLYFNF